RAIALQKRRSQLAALHSKVFEARRTAALRFERDHPSIIKDFAFPKGALVLMRNTAIEKSLNRKMRARYLGPYVVLSRNRGGAYILAELDGATFDRPVAAFRLVPYLARKQLTLPPLQDFIDVPLSRIAELEDSDEIDPEAE
ncbi:hypothetical protein BV25DRAFT_1765069, partial [Artomyces pyxidatus]